MQTLNPNLSTQPKARQKGDFLFQAQSEALGEPPLPTAPQGCPTQAGTGGSKVVLAAS